MSLHGYRACWSLRVFGGHVGVIVTALLLVADMSQTAFAQVTSVPTIIENGFQAYQTSGARSAVKAWLKDSPTAVDASILRDTPELLGRVESSYGRYVGFDPVGALHIGKHVTRTLVVILYEKGALYSYFDVYRSTSGWVVLSFQFNTKPDAVFPQHFLESLTMGTER